MTGVRPEWIASNDFIMVHRGLVAALDGDYEAAMVLDRIRFRSAGPGSVNGWWEASRDELREECCLSKWKCDQAVKVLKEAGFLESERITPYDPTQRWRVVVENQEQVVPENQEQVVAKTGITVMQDSGITPSSKKEKNPPTPQRGAEFEEFWSLYPRKEGKGKAHEAWDKHVTDPAAVLAALRRQLPALTAKERKYQPMPTTWLNQTRWEDEAQPVQKDATRMFEGMR